MAGTNAITNQKKTSLVKEEIWWGDVWTGTEDEVVDAGLVERHMLPGKPGRNKLSQTYNKKSDGPNYIRIKKKRKGLYEVWKGIPQEERYRREKESDKKWEAQRQIKRAMSLYKEGPEHVRKALRKQIEETVGILSIDICGMSIKACGADAKSAVVWAELKKYDKEDLIQEITADMLCWIDSRGTEKKITYKRLHAGS